MDPCHHWHRSALIGTSMKPTCTRLGLPIAITLALTAATGVHAATITVNSADDNAASTLCNLRDALTSIDNGNTTSTPTCAGAVSGTFGSDDTVVFASGLKLQFLAASS